MLTSPRPQWLCNPGWEKDLGVNCSVQSGTHREWASVSHRLTSFSCSLVNPHSPPLTLASLPFLKQARHRPTPGRSQRPRTFFPQMSINTPHSPTQQPQNLLPSSILVLASTPLYLSWPPLMAHTSPHLVSFPPYHSSPPNSKWLLVCLLSKLTRLLAHGNRLICSLLITSTKHSQEILLNESWGDGNRRWSWTRLYAGAIQYWVLS